MILRIEDRINLMRAARGSDLASQRTFITRFSSACACDPGHFAAAIFKLVAPLQRIAR
jgi:hypothetical protein